MMIRYRKRHDLEEEHIEQSPESEDEEQQEEELKEAVSTIQKYWRRKHPKEEVVYEGETSRPLGFYTHTLALTYAKAKKKSYGSWMEEETQEPLGIRIFAFLDDPSSSPAAQAFFLLIIFTTIVSIVGFVLETDPALHNWSPEFWLILEVVCTGIFSFEYGMNLVVCEAAGLSRCAFLRSPTRLCDLAAVLPFYVEVLLSSVGFRGTAVLRAFKVVRLIRVLRVFKLGKYASGLQMIVKALRESMQAISVLVFLMSVGVVLFSSALFHVEKLSCPELAEMSTSHSERYAAECADDFNRGVSPMYGLCCTEDSTPRDFPSIPAACWWAVVTMTSVGYGEVYPKTSQGKFIGVLAMVAGLLLIALPVAIIGQKFQDLYEVNDRQEAKDRSARRMSIPGEVWTLVPGSDLIIRLKYLKLKDPEVAHAIATMTNSVESIWELREGLGRERKFALGQREKVDRGLGRLLTAMDQ